MTCNIIEYWILPIEYLTLDSWVLAIEYWSYWRLNLYEYGSLFIEYWITNVVFQYWTLKFEYWIRNVEFWIPNIEFWIVNVEICRLNIWYWMLNMKVWMLILTKKYSASISGYYTLLIYDYLWTIYIYFTLNLKLLHVKKTLVVIFSFPVLQVVFTFNAFLQSTTSPV